MTGYWAGSTACWADKTESEVEYFHFSFRLNKHLEIKLYMPYVTTHTG
jgi:hypothetical protein